MSFAIVIPARLSSRRLPKKPLQPLCGKPLIRWVCESALKVTDCVVLATDSEEIAKAVEGLNVRVILTPAELPSGTDRVAYAVKEAKLSQRWIINLQGDEPFVEKKHVFPIFEKLKDGEQFVTLAVPFKERSEVTNPNRVKVVLNRQGYALYFSRSVIPFDRDKDLSASFYLKHIGIYGFEKEALFEFVNWPQTPLEKAEKLEQLRILEMGRRIFVCIADSYTHGVDTKEDLLKAEQILRGETWRQR